MKTISLKLPETLDADLAALAQDQGVSKSELMRQALAELLRQGRPATRGSALALVEDLVGCVDGPEDLASNPVYLADLGR